MMKFRMRSSTMKISIDMTMKVRVEKEDEVLGEKVDDEDLD